MKQARDIVNVAVVNFKVATGDKEKNLNRLCGFAEAAAKRGAEIILFPEMCLMGYDYYVDEKIQQQEKILSAETVQGDSVKELEKIAVQYGVYIVFGMAELPQADLVRVKEGRFEEIKLYNSAVIIGPEGIIGAYQKIHPFETESIWCEKGDTPFMFDTKWGPVGVGICFDTYQFPELMRYYTQKGCRLYLNPTAVIEEIPKECSRQAFINYYAPTLEYGVLCNTIFIASANLTGFDDVNYFGGGSCVIGPKINPFFETDVTYYAGDKDNVQEELSLATLDLSLATRPLFVNSKFTGTPDYRPELYKKFI